MQEMTLPKRITSGLIAAAMLAGSAGAVLAMPPMETSNTTASGSAAAGNHVSLKDIQTKVKERLDSLKLQQCERRKSLIVQHTTKATDTVASIESKFDSIATKVEQFKTDKAITVDNYDGLLADITAKKAKVDTDLAAAKTQAQAFDCASDGPKAQLHDFVMSMELVRQDLKDYRTSIKNLIQAVRQANGQNRQSTASASPSAKEAQ